MAQRHTIGHPDDDSAKQVHRRDNQPGDRVAANEFARTIHRSVEFRFARQFVSPTARFFAVDLAGRQFGVDRHLLPGQCVERESSGHFGDPAGTFCDDHELNRDQNEKDHQSHDEIAADDVVAKCTDDVARVSVQQNQACRGNVQRQTKQRQKQQ